MTRKDRAKNQMSGKSKVRCRTLTKAELRRANKTYGSIFEFVKAKR